MARADKNLKGCPRVPIKGMTSIVYIKNDAGEFACPFDDCDFTTSKQNTMHYHQKKHTGEKSHVCTVCTKDFVQKSGLDQHMAQVHRDVADPGNIYADISWTCPCCSHTCKMKNNMRMHITRKHCTSWVPPMKDGSCTGCNKGFKSAPSYYYHAATCFAAAMPTEMKAVITPFL